jgi:predicted Rossmann-fold nucleotide-binding protein
MNAVSRAFSEVPARRGLVIGIVPSAAEGTAAEPRQGYPNPWVEITVFTHLPMSGRSGTDPMSRNHINVLSSNVLVALPGGSGTASEVSLAIRYGRPVVAYLRARDEIPELPAAVRVEGDLERIKEFVREKIG